MKRQYIIKMKKAKGNKGITLIELLVVVSIIGILAVALGFSFQGWMGAYKVESIVKEVYSDLMDARSKAMTSGGMSYYVDINAASYQIFQDTNGDPANDVGDTPMPGFATPKPLRQPNFQLRFDPAGTSRIFFDSRGLSTFVPSSLSITIYVTLPDGTVAGASGGYDPDYGCIAVGLSRIRMGHTEHTSGVYDSCTQK